jgi:hypothetical protein
LALGLVRAAHYNMSGASPTLEPPIRATHAAIPTQLKMTEKPRAASSALLSTHLVAHPDHTAKRAIHTQFPLPNPLIRLVRRFAVKHSVIKGMTESEWKKFERQAPELMRKAGWKPAGAPAEDEGVEVGELFWKVGVGATGLM